jgi:hypothetical protein
MRSLPLSPLFAALTRQIAVSPLFATLTRQIAVSPLFATLTKLGGEGGMRIFLKWGISPL